MRQKKIWLIAVIVVLSTVTAVAGYSFYQVQGAIDDVQIDTDGAILPEHESDASDRQPRDEADEPEDFYVLLFGLDQRGDSIQLNTDSIIVAHFVPQLPAVKLLSLPRDLRIYDHEDNPLKINSVFSVGYMHAYREADKNPDLLSGRKVKLGDFQIAEEYVSSGMVMLRKEVEDLLDIDIRSSVLIQFNTVTELVDAVGGVDVEVDRYMTYHPQAEDLSIELHPGWQTLDGQNALNYMRFRQDDRGEAFYSNDFERAARQQQVITALVDKLASWKSLSRVFDVLNIVSKHVKTDLSRGQMFDLVRDYYGKLDGSNVVSVPFEAYWEYPYTLISDEDLERAKAQFSSVTADP